MPSAICPHCGESAYSSADFNRVWTCPYCGKQVIPRPSAAQRSSARDSTVEYYSRFWTAEESAAIKS